MSTILAPRSLPSVTILVEIPEELHEVYRKFVETHPEWDCDSLVSAALAAFLLQNGGQK